MRYAPLFVLLSGCAGIEQAVHKTGELLAGVPPDKIADVTATVSTALPEPWGLIVSGVGGAVAGVGAWLYRRRLLRTSPPVD